MKTEVKRTMLRENVENTISYIDVNVDDMEHYQEDAMSRLVLPLNVQKRSASALSCADIT